MKHPDPLQLGEQKEAFLAGSISLDSTVKKLIEDLELREFGESCFGYPSVLLPNYIAFVLANNLKDEKSILGQHKAIEELSMPEQYQNLNILLRSMAKLKKKVETRNVFWDIHSEIQSKLEILSDYKNLLDGLENVFNDSQAYPLHSIANFAKEIKNSEEYSRFLPLVVERGMDSVKVHLEITLDVVGGVTKMRFKKPEYGPKVPWNDIVQHYLQGVKHGPGASWMYKRRILYALKSILDENSESIKGVVDLALDLEFYQAMVNYERLMNMNGIPTVIPEITEDGVAIKGMRHALQAAIGKKEVPNDYYSDKNERVLLMTGANDSGKSYYGKARAICQLLFQRGCKIPAEYARMRIVDNVYTHFGEKDNVLKGMGLYLSDLSRMRTIMESLTSKSLIVIDEPCKGTDKQGEAQSFYFLEAFSETGAEVIFNSHFHGLGKMVENMPSVRMMHPITELSDSKKLVYKRTMAPGPAGTSYALEVAESAGFGREALMEKARAAKNR